MYRYRTDKETKNWQSSYRNIPAITNLRKAVLNASKIQEESNEYESELETVYT